MASNTYNFEIPFYSWWQLSILYGIPLLVATFIAVNGHLVGGWMAGSQLSILLFTVGTALIYGKREILD